MKLLLPILIVCAVYMVEANTKKKNSICTLPLKVGNCFDKQRAYYFDATAGTCKEFLYSNCGGNENNFDTKSGCEKACQRVTPVQNAPSACKDIYGIQCSMWARSGYCTEKLAFMETGCCASCCKDVQENCAIWARQGYCTKNPLYMKPNCCASCRSVTPAQNEPVGSVTPAQNEPVGSVTPAQNEPVGKPCHEELEKMKDIPNKRRPRCSADGLYYQKQCQNFYLAKKACWCVVPETGKEVPGTRKVGRRSYRVKCRNGRDEPEYYEDQHQDYYY